tara:strand:- start:254 stop:550 length:297 start_codon:yes stop_codon:yes gene_type:complete
MNRYEKTKIKLDKTGIRTYTTTYYPSIPIENSDKFIVTKTGDRLDNLAFKYYGDTTLWWILAKANGIRGKVALAPSEILRIPGNIRNILEKFDDLNRR